MVMGRKAIATIIGIACTLGTGAGALTYVTVTSPATAQPAHTPPAQPAGFRANGTIDGTNTCIPIYSATAVNHVEHNANGTVKCTVFGPPPSGTFGNGS